MNTKSKEYDILSGISVPLNCWLILAFSWFIMSFFLDTTVILPLYIAVIIISIIAFCSKPLLQIKSRQYVFLLLFIALLLRALFFIITLSDSFNWDNGSNQGIAFTDGDFLYYAGMSESILQSWSNGLNFELFSSYLPIGTNGLFFCHFISLVNYLTNDINVYTGHTYIAFIQLFVFHAVRIYIVYRLSYNCFKCDKLSRICATMVAFDPYILRWDLVLMKESLLILLIVLNLYMLSQFKQSNTKVKKALYLLFSISINYIIFLDRFYLGIFLLSGLFTIIVTGNNNTLRRMFRFRVLAIFSIFTTIVILYTAKKLNNITALALISENSVVTFGSPLGLIQIFLTPLPFRAATRFDVELLIFYGFPIYYTFLSFFLLGFIKLLLNRLSLMWLIMPFCFLILVLAITIPGGSRRRDNFLPIVYIISAYGIVKTQKQISLPR